MQKDIASVVGRQLENVNETAQLIQVVKNQADEIKRRGNRIVDLEDKNEMLQKNLNVIVASNKQLEAMIESLRSERVKLLEEIEELKKQPTSVVEKTLPKKKKTKEVEVVAERQ